jgi:hypothetical protein
MHILALAFVTLLALTAAAGAEDFQVGGETLSIDPPDGYCALDRSHPADAFILGAIEKTQAGANQVLMQFALCQQLEDWHAGRIPNYSNYGGVTVQLEDGTPRSIRMSRRDFIVGMQTHMPKADMTDIENEINAKLEGLAAISNSQMLGVVGKDGSALYIGVLGTVEVGGERTLLAGVTSITLLRSFVVNTNLYAPAEPEMHDHLLAIQKAYLAELVRQNP